jgi:phosphoribosylformylglycinamidine cyclo-ligase
MNTPTPAYTQVGVDQDLAGAAVAALVKSLAPRDPNFKSRQQLASGHFANVIKVAENLGIALSADGVGTKLLIAEQLGRFDTVGIDCVAMNVNDVLCVGSKPVAMLDYLAVQTAEPNREAQLGIGLRIGAERAGIEIPGGELAQLGDVMNGFDLAGACFGTVALDSLITGEAIQPGDVVVGLPSTGLHANGYTLARKALDGLSLAEDPDGLLGRSLGEVLIEPTEIYVKPVLELLESGVSVHGLAHITSEGFDNLLRLHAPVGYRIDAPLPVPPIFGLIQQRLEVADAEMREVFNLGCGFCCVIPEGSVDSALVLLRQHYPDARPIGFATDSGKVTTPPNWPSSNFAGALG